MWCPSASLAIWANAWLAGRAAPDDVLDALSLWAPRHSVTAYDAEAAGRTGLPWPDLDDAGAVSLLQTVRTAAGPRTAREPAIAVAIPVPGDVRGLPVGTTFARGAIDAGEALLITAERGTAIGLVPEFEYDDLDEDDCTEPGFDALPDLCALSWTAYSLPAPPVLDQSDLGSAELELRAAVRSAADTMDRLRAGGPGADVDDPRALIEELLESARAHRAPDHAPVRAIRVLENAAQVEAIITVGAGLMPIATQSGADVATAGAAIRPLAGVVRSARLAAVGAILQSAWQ